MKRAPCNVCGRNTLNRILGEVVCSKCADLFRHDEVSECPNCGAEYLINNGVKSDNLDETFCSQFCADNAEEEQSEHQEHIRLESHSSNFI